MRWLAQKVAETGTLREGSPGETFWTDSRFGTAEGAQKRLALPNKSEVQVEFRLKAEPKLSREGSRVKPDYGHPGGGREYSSFEPVKVETVNVQKY